MKLTVVQKNFQKALKKFPEEEFVIPQIITANKTPLNGNYIITNEDEDKNIVHNILYYVNKNSPLGPIPSNPSRDNQFSNWEASVLNWAIRFIPGTSL